MTARGSNEAWEKLKAEAQALFDDSRTEFAGDCLLDFAETETALKLLADVEAYCLAENTEALRAYWLLRLQDAAAALVHQ